MTNQAIAWVRFQQALTPDKPFYMYFATGATHAPHHAPEGVHRQVQGQVRPGLGQAPRGDAGAADRAGRRSRGHQADGTPEGDPGVGLALGRPEAAVRPADGDVRRLRRAHRPRDRPAGEGDRGHGRARQHADLLHRRRQRLQRRRRARTAPTTRCSPSTASSATSPRSCRTSTSGAGRRPSRTSPSAGRTPATRRSSGPSRWRRTSAARATRWSSTGPKGSRPRAKCARSSIT